ncbi:MAG: hypothetical protein AAFX04_06800 [Pseudomonadota bacterium]
MTDYRRSSTIIRRSAASLLAIAVLGVAMAPIYGQDQDAPESLLPPGFGDPAPAPTPAPAEPTPPAANPTPAPGPVPTQAPPVEAQPALTAPAETPETIQPLPSDAPVSADAGDVGDDALLEDVLVEQELAPSALPVRARRTLGQVGLIGTSQGGFDSGALVAVNGPYVTSILANIDKPIVSRWGHILLRRVLVSDLQSPAGADDTAWIAARTRLLINMGESSLARHLSQQVDAARYAGPLYDAGRDAALASADLTGFCPISTGGAAQSDDARWQLVLAICAAMSGNSSSASAQIDRASNNQLAAEIDLQLTEKVVGAGVNGRRAVRVDWDGVDRLTLWRFGLATATGAQPPEALYEQADRRFQAWRAENPAASLDARLQSAEIAAAMGVLSSRAIIDLYAMAFDEGSTPAGLRQRTVLLREAYRQRDPGDRLAALEQLWNRSENPLVRYGNHVLTARAAARFPVMSDYAYGADNLVAAMFSAGLDRNAVRWDSLVSEGSLAWGLITLGQPSTGEQTAESLLRNFADNDPSDNYRKTAFLIAGMAALDRTSNAIAEELAAEYGFALRAESRWQQALAQAAEANNAPLTAIVAAAGMQAQDWSGMAPAHLYHIVQALNRVGLEAEARMIAVEAVSRA